MFCKWNHFSHILWVYTVCTPLNIYWLELSTLVTQPRQSFMIFKKQSCRNSYAVLHSVVILHMSDDAAGGAFIIILGLVSLVVGVPGTQQVVYNFKSQVLGFCFCFSQVTLCLWRAQPWRSICKHSCSYPEVNPGIMYLHAWHDSLSNLGSWLDIGILLCFVLQTNQFMKRLELSSFYLNPQSIDDTHIDLLKN